MFNTDTNNKGVDKEFQRWPANDLGAPKAMVSPLWINEFEKPENSSKPESIWDLSSDQAYERGLAEGREATSAELKATAQLEATNALTQLRELQELRFQTAYSDFCTQLKGSEVAIAERLIELAVRLASATVRHHILVDPAAVLPIVEEALAQLLPGARDTLIHVSSEDEPILRRALAVELDAGRVQLLTDAKLTRTDIRMIGATTELDHTLEARWTQALIQSGITRTAEGQA